MTCAQDAEPAKNGSPTTQPSLGPELAAWLTPLINALHAQTAAINALANSNYALVRAMVESEGMDPNDTGGYSGRSQPARGT